MELIRHLLGLCPDHAAHMNLMDMLLGGGLLAFAGGYFRHLKTYFSSRKSNRPPTHTCDHSCPHDHKH